jgi:peptidoglycan LD-endopeptidase CwlK
MVGISMPAYGKRSRERLETCDPKLQALMNEVIKHKDVTILHGFRGEAAQNALFKSGHSKLKWPLSKHNAMVSGAGGLMVPNARAVDFAPWVEGKGPIMGDGKIFPRVMEWHEFYHTIGMIRGIASQMGIAVRSGADWDGDTWLHNNNFNDLFHVELV